MKTGITCAGNWIRDHFKVIDVYPPEETLSNILSETAGGGGLAYNVLTDLARMKVPFPLRGIGLVGDDADGRWIQEDARHNGIDMTRVRVTREAPTSYTDVFTVQSNGKRTFFHCRGANALLGPNDLEPDGSKIVHLGYLLLLDSLDRTDPEFGTIAARVLKRWRDAGVKTSVDVVSEASSRFAKVVTPALSHTDYLICNEIEAGQVTGHKIRTGMNIDRDALKSSAKKLLGKGPELVVIHMPEGGYLVSKQGDHWEPSIKLPPGHIKSTAGAGDAFAAACLFALHEGWAHERMLKLAHAAAAACLAHETTTQGLKPIAQLIG
jgi:sugar/nucleoside kinase (ribokinase family)